MLEKALKIANRFLNDNNTSIISYAETDEYYLFEYEGDIDNCMIKVNKKTLLGSYYVITQHFDELNKLTFKDIDVK